MTELQLVSRAQYLASTFHINEMTVKRLNPIRKVEHGFRECPLKDLQHSEQTSSVRTRGFLNVNMALKPGRVLSGTAARSILHWTPLHHHIHNHIITPAG